MYILYLPDAHPPAPPRGASELGLVLGSGARARQLWQQLHQPLLSFLLDLSTPAESSAKDWRVSACVCFAGGRRGGGGRGGDHGAVREQHLDEFLDAWRQVRRILLRPTATPTDSALVVARS
jgi:hypothetical protein